jgi:hypothetical protein
VIPLKNNILVSVNLAQKEEAIIGGNLLKTGKNYNENFRERNPVIAKVIHGCKEIKSDTYIVCNYSHFDLESPHHVSDNFYSIPVDEEIYAIVNDEDGSLTPVCGNVLVEEVFEDSQLRIPIERRKSKINQGIVSHGTYEGKYIFWLPYSNYTIVYSWNNEERRAIKVHEKEITGYLK